MSDNDPSLDFFQVHHHTRKLPFNFPSPRIFCQFGKHSEKKKEYWPSDGQKCPKQFYSKTYVSPIRKYFEKGHESNYQDN
jgi:hypothetical protein